jgi:hypothetical protein
MEKVEHRMNGKTQSHQSIALLIASRLSPSRRSGHYLSGARNVSFSITSIELPRLRERQPCGFAMRQVHRKGCKGLNRRNSASNSPISTSRKKTL